MAFLIGAVVSINKQASAISSHEATPKQGSGSNEGSRLAYDPVREASGNMS